MFLYSFVQLCSWLFVIQNYDIRDYDKSLIKMQLNNIVK